MKGLLGKRMKSLKRRAHGGMNLAMSTSTYTHLPPYTSYNSSHFPCYSHFTSQHLAIRPNPYLTTQNRIQPLINSSPTSLYSFHNFTLSSSQFFSSSSSQPNPHPTFSPPKPSLHGFLFFNLTYFLHCKESLHQLRSTSRPRCVCSYILGLQAQN